MAKDFRRALRDGVIVFDGAMGTMLQRFGLTPGGCPDELNITNPEMVQKVHRAFRDAGSDVVTTNTFGSTRPKLEEYGLEGKLKEINIAAAQNGRKAMGDSGFVAGDIGPTGALIEPVGEMAFDEAVEIFAEQAGALKEGGVDLIIIETMMDIKEMKAAIIGAKRTGLPIIATMTFDETMTTVFGTTPESFAVVAEGLGVDCIGANCSLGIGGLLKAVSAMNSLVSVPLIAQANAGLPELKDGVTVFPDTPEDMTAYVERLAEVGVRILGGCCGTTPEHLKMMGDTFRSLTPAAGKEGLGFTALASRGSIQLFGTGLPGVIVGERINPTGRKQFAALIKEGKISGIRKEAKEQSEAGAHILDINVGVPDIDEDEAMKRAVFCVNDSTSLPVVIDSSYITTLESGLKAADGKALVNSVSGEEKKLDTILPLVHKYGAAVLGLTLDDKGIPDKAEERLRIAEVILERALSIGMKREDLVIDALAMTVSANQESALETLKAIGLIKSELGLATILGVSNISFGLPDRKGINSAFLTMALQAGLDAAIVNPSSSAMIDSYYAANVLLNDDPRAERYIARYQGKIEGEDAVNGPKKKEKPKTLEARMSLAIVEGDEENIVSIVEEALQEGWDPIKISNEGLIPGLTKVGVLFASNRYFLPQVILSADTMKRAFTRLKEEMKGADVGPTVGKVLMATVEGDIHDIGKNIVCTLLENHGFEVVDMGKNVPTSKIVERAKEGDIDIVGLSALMTTTVMEMDNVLKKLRENNIDVKTIVGGAVVTPEFATKIGADAYGEDALASVETMKGLLN